MTKSSVRKLKTNAGGGRGRGAYKNLAAQFRKIWREAEESTRSDMSKKSRFRYRDSMSNFLRFCAENFNLQKISNISEKHLRAYVEYRRREGVSEKTLKNDLSGIRFFHRYANSRYSLPDNQSLEIDKTSPGGKERAWTDEEYRKMADKAAKLNRRDVVASMKLARHAGLRIHECTRLTVGHLKRALNGGDLVIKGKGGRVRRVPVRPELRPELELLLKQHGSCDDEKIFVPPGQQTHAVIKSIQKFIHHHRREFTERKITFHGLRHSYARQELAKRISHLNKNGIYRKDLVRTARLEVAELLGHGRPEVTAVYTGKSK